MLGRSSRCCVVAEIGSVHDGSFGNAQKLIEAAAAAGADVVKFQTHLPAAETIRDAPSPPYFKGEPRFEYFARTGFTLPQWRQLKAHCDECKVEFISSPFSVEAVRLLEEVGVGRYKVGSGEVTNLPMLEVIAQTGKPVVLSSGMSNWAELDDAVATLTAHHRQVIILQCTSEYPCPDEGVGLNLMVQMRERYGLEVGLSDHTDHTLEIFAPGAQGDRMIEKHFTFSRLMYGSDARHSLEPGEFSHMVKGIRAAERMRAPVDKDAVAARLGDMKRIFEKSVVAVVDIPAGAVLSLEMLAVKKPGTGIPARRLASLVGRRTARAIMQDSLLSEEDLHA